MKVSYRNEINSMKAYIPGKPIEEVQQELGLEKIVKLASNENPLGCSPLAKQAIQNAMDNISLYPDGNAGALKKAVAKHWNLEEEQLIFGAGSDELLGVIAEVFLTPGSEVLTAEQSFPRYDSAAHLMGSDITKVPLTDYTYDLKEMQKYITENTKLIILANPNNPTGTYFTQTALLEFLNKVPSNILVVLDEAYYEYVGAADYPQSLQLLKQYNNLIILRTFSKAYGLASLRVGYGIAHPKTIELLNRVRNPFNVNTLAQAAAIASLEDQDFVKEAIAVNAQSKTYMYQALERLEIPFVSTEANFIMFDAKRPSDILFEKFQKHGFIIRPAFGVPNWVRVTLGTLDQMEAFVDILEQIY